MKANQWYFYRVEREDGSGPYWEQGFELRSQWMQGWHGSRGDEVHPSISWEVDIDDMIANAGYSREQCIYGFQTLTQLQRWFDSEELRKLNRLGYRIVRVLGVEVVSTSTQSMFVKV